MARPCQLVPECAISEKPLWTGDSRGLRTIKCQPGCLRPTAPRVVSLVIAIVSEPHISQLRLAVNPE